LLALNDRGLFPPVILGGAALNRRYVEEDLRKLYRGTLFYGEDAFDGLRIMDDLAARKRLKDVGSTALRGIADRIKPPRIERSKPTAEPECCPTHVAIPRPAGVNGRRSHLPPAPDRPPAPFLGSRVATDIRTEDVFAFLNERTLFSTQWQFRKGKAGPAEYARQMREVAEPTLARLKRQCLDENILRPAVVYGYFPCAARGNDLVIYEDDGRTERLRFTFPRQDGGEFLCLSDYFAVDDAAADVVAFMAVTMGDEVSHRAKALFEAGKYTDYLYLHGVGVEAAEALAELWHKRIRGEWGIASEDAADVRKLFKKHYRGCRYSFGYPACPDLEDQAQLFELLQPERIGLGLSEQYQLEPEQSTTALVVHHPAAKYFNVAVPQAG
jgi:5-methyltetrahydrofolate--homocysteine methyltransferase